MRERQFEGAQIAQRDRQLPVSLPFQRDHRDLMLNPFEDTGMGC